MASMVAAQEPSPAGVILGGGAYDMQDAYDRLEEVPEGRESLKRNIRNEAGATPESFRERSILLTDLKITVPTLILHGEEDPVSPVDHARRLANRLQEWGTPVELVVFPGVAHGIPREQRKLLWTGSSSASSYRIRPLAISAAPSETRLDARRCGQASAAAGKPKSTPGLASVSVAHSRREPLAGFSSSLLSGSAPRRQSEIPK